MANAVISWQVALITTIPRVRKSNHSGQLTPGGTWVGRYAKHRCRDQRNVGSNRCTFNVVKKKLVKFCMIFAVKVNTRSLGLSQSVAYTHVHMTNAQYTVPQYTNGQCDFRVRNKRKKFVEKSRITILNLSDNNIRKNSGSVSIVVNVLE